jgi:alpha-galactosidase/6-phospho-beta-glucosidase family protein
MAFVHDIRLDGEPVLDHVLARVEQFELGIPAQAHHDVLMVPSWELVFNPAHLHAGQLAQRNRASVLLDIERACQHLVDRGESDPACYLELLSQRNCDWYGIAVAPLLALCLGQDSGEAIVNIAVSDVFQLGLPHCVVETNAVVDADGARALAIPEAVRNHELFDHCRAAKQAESLLLTSILNQDYATLMGACQVHPMIRSPRAVARYFSRLTECDPQIARFVFGKRPIPWPAHQEDIR